MKIHSNLFSISLLSSSLKALVLTQIWEEDNSLLLFIDKEIENQKRNVNFPGSFFQARLDPNASLPDSKARFSPSAGLPIFHHIHLILILKIVYFLKVVFISRASENYLTAVCGHLYSFLIACVLIAKLFPFILTCSLMSKS